VRGRPAVAGSTSQRRLAATPSWRRVAASRPDLNIATIHPPGCGQAVSLSPVLHQVTLFRAGTVLGTVPVPPGGKN